MFVIAGLFAWTEFGNLAEINPSLAIPFITGVLACTTLVIALVSYFVAPLPQLGGSLYLNYLLSLLAIIMLTVETGGVHSAYLPLFFVSLPFANLLGIAGTITSLLALIGFITYEYLLVGLSTSEMIELAVLGGITVVGSFLLWGRTETTDSETKEDRSYHELASQLSQVAGKSEVVINAIGDGVLALNAGGIIQLINPAAERILGWQSHDALNLSYKSIFKLLNSKNQPVEDINDPVAKALNDNKPEKNDSFSLQTQSGKSFLANINVSPVGQPGEGVIIVFRDITTEKSDERQRAEFISTASHEMRTPVASIEGYLGLVLNPKITTIDDKARDYITKAHESAQHLGRLFADLLDVSKADDSRLKNDPKVVDVVPFVHDIVEGLTPKAIEKGLMVLYKPMPDSERKVELSERRITPVYYANVDNDHLREIVQNLIENAIKYTLKGQVTIDVTGDESHITVTIADTGIGIPREDQAHLFQKFYRVDNSDTREIGGTGLGLYLCRRLTETIGGRLWLESEYQHGSTFYVEIPRLTHDEATKLIEQASVEAEREAAAEKTGIIPETTSTPLVEAPGAAQAVPTYDTVASQPQPTPDVYQPPVVPVPAMEALPQPPEPPRVQIPVQVVPEAITSPAPIAPSAPLPPAQPAPVPQAASNTPLSAIEANPTRYIADRRSQSFQISVPPRGQ